jgi:hypothetical protein
MLENVTAYMRTQLERTGIYVVGARKPSRGFVFEAIPGTSAVAALPSNSWLPVSPPRFMHTLLLLLGSCTLSCSDSVSSEHFPSPTHSIPFARS